MRGAGRVLLIGSPDPGVRKPIAEAAQGEGYRVEWAGTRAELLERLGRKPPCAAVVIDRSAAAMGGLDSIRQIRRLAPRARVVMISEVRGVEPLPAGAAVSLTHPETYGSAGGPGPFFFGPSPQMRELERLAGEIARSEAHVLIRGETGVGKESLARHIHRLSRGGSPLLVVRCGALDASEAQGSFLSYCRHAPGGAVEHIPGLIERAGRGTVLLDGLDLLPESLQSELLAVLRGRLLAMGSFGPRLISCSSADLESLVAGGRLNATLFYILNVIPISIPPLRHRGEDILPLAEFLLRRHAGPGAPAQHLTSDVAHQFMAEPWPGNALEMENRIRRLLLLDRAEGAMDGAAAGPAAAASASPPAKDFEQVTNAAEAAEIQAIFRALNATWWNRRSAAARLRISYKALLYRMKKYAIDDKIVFMSRPSAKPPKTKPQS